MNLYLVKATLNGSCRVMWIKCRSEDEAAERAQAELNYGGKIVEVRFIRRESPSLF